MVRVQISERHCDVPDDLLERTEDQIEALGKFDPRASSADVVYTEEKLTRKVEVVIHIDGSEPVIAHGDGMGFRSALDQVVDRLGRMLRKQRQQRVDHQAPPLSDGITSE